MCESRQKTVTALKIFLACANESVPRAVASEAFEKGVLMEPRSLPLAVLKGLIDGTSLATACGADSEV
jgi:hypothetical protein